jgi:uncharacterized protein (DUF305 family)
MRPHIQASQVGSYVPLRLMALATAAAALALAPHSASSHDRPGRAGGGFQATIGEAVARMHSAMHLPFSGDVDRDFARMMIPHHQGAIDMAIAELRYGKDERLRRLAQEIIVEQQQEIAVMHLALGDVVSPGTPSPTQVEPAGETAKEP